MCKSTDSILFHEGFWAGLVGDIARGRFGAELRTEKQEPSQTWGLERASQGALVPKEGAGEEVWGQSGAPCLPLSQFC